MTKNTRYIQTFRNKWITSNAKTIDDMIAVYEGLAAHFKEMRDAGIALDPDSGVSDDYATLVTEDPAVATKYGLEDEAKYWGEEGLREVATPASRAASAGGSDRRDPQVAHRACAGADPPQEVSSRIQPRS